MSALYRRSWPTDSACRRVGLRLRRTNHLTGNMCQIPHTTLRRAHLNHDARRRSPVSHPTHENPWRTLFHISTSSLVISERLVKFAN